MTWLVIGIVLFLIEFLVLRNSTFFEYKYGYDQSSYSSRLKRTEEQPVKIKLWWILLLAIGNLPVASIITFVVFWCLWGFKAGEDGGPKTDCTYWRLHSKPMKKLINFLNKEV